MARSMTAYGRAVGSTETKNITVEIKSVNSRYFDPQIKISRSFSYLEEKVKNFIQSYISRGKVDVWVGVEVTENQSTEIRIDKAYAETYINALRALRDEFDLHDDISVMRVAQNKDIFIVTASEEDEEAAWNEILPFLQQAIDVFMKAREAEGEKLIADILKKKEHIAELSEKVASHSAEATSGYRDKLEARIRAFLEDHTISIDESRILTECAIYADKIAVDEELVRLSSHFTAFDDILKSSEPIGKRLDFLIQEMNRETNTIGSKCSDSKIAHIVVEMKNELEKIREQIQNIE
ncbi:MAG: YicC family protein [Ruminococcaceae bacterium]|nr:YicC family protein [Oscillospiraceae bacterium]